MKEAVCSGCLAHGWVKPGEEFTCFGCRSELVPCESARWALTSRGGQLHLLDRTTGSAAMPVPNVGFSGELVRLLNLADDLRTVLKWWQDRCAATLVVADMAAMAWLASIDLDHVPTDDAEVLRRFVARTEYLEGGVEATGSITEDVIRPLADRVGLPGQRILDRLADAELVVARAIAEAAELLCRIDPAIESHRAACGAFDALRWVLEGSEAHRPSAMLDSVTE